MPQSACLHAARSRDNHELRYSRCIFDGRGPLRRIHQRLARGSLPPTPLLFIVVLSFRERSVYVRIHPDFEVREFTMTTRAGIWIDQRDAILVQLSDADRAETITQFRSEAEKQTRRSADRTTGAFEPVNVEADDTRDRKFNADLAQYFDAIASQLTTIEQLLIVGPGEAKVHFKKHLETGYRAPQTVTVETADRITDAELVAKVKDFFKSA